MKHLNNFNESVDVDYKSFFKDKVDWKFYNYLVDKFTELEDAGYKVSYTISVNVNTNVSSMVFYERDNKKTFSEIKSPEIRGYFKYGLKYTINIYAKNYTYPDEPDYYTNRVSYLKFIADSKNRKFMYDVLKGVVDKIKHKCKPDIYHNYDTIVVRPIYETIN